MKTLTLYVAIQLPPGHLLQSKYTDETPSSFKFTKCNLVHPDKIIGTQ